MRLTHGTAFLLAFGVLFDGCGSRREAAPPAATAAPAATQGDAPAQAEQPPVRITYANDPAVYIKGQAIPPNTPYLVGGASGQFRANPHLPKGLEMDPATGVISGTPLEVTPAGTYLVTATNGAGSTSHPLAITVNDPPPSSAPAVTLPPFVTAGKADLKASIPDQGKGTAYAWNVTGGSLVTGQGTPSVTFSAATAGTVEVSVTVSNSGGTITGKGIAAIVPAPDATLTFPLVVRPGQGGLQAQVPGQPDMQYTWTILAGSSSASVTAGQGTHSVQLSVGPTPGTFEIQVQVQNQAGDRSIAKATVKVQA